MKAEYEKEKKAVGYLLPDYAEKPWPREKVLELYNKRRKRKQNYPWLEGKNE